MCAIRSNFFEKRVGDYQKANVMSSIGSAAETGNAFSTEEDF